MRLLKAGYMSEACRILTSLPTGEAVYILHKNHGQLIIEAVKSIFFSIGKDKDVEADFKVLYSTLLDLDEEYTDKKVTTANQKIIKESSNPRDVGLSLFHIGKLMDKIYRDRAESKIITEKEICDEDYSAGSVDDKAATAPDVSTSSNQVDSTNDNLNTINPKDDDIAQNDNAIFIHRSKTDTHTIKTGNVDINSNYIFNFFFGWLNNLPQAIRDSIEQSSAFQLLLAHYNELQAVFGANQNKIVVHFLDEVIENAESGHDYDNHYTNNESAIIKYDHNNFIDMDSVIDPSLLPTTLVVEVSGVNLFNYQG